MSGGAGTDSIVGSGSNMPVDMYLRKIEQTAMYESPDQVEDFHRSTLKDLTPLPELFESDQVRGGRDSKGNALGNPLSNQFLTWQHTGRRTEAEPYLPEGSFTDWQFLEKDPRGVATGPDMKKHVSQQYARGKFYKYTPDNDDSVPESGVNPYQMQMDIRNAQNTTKDYFKIFQTSYDAWTNEGIAPGYSRSKKELLAPISGEVKDPVHAPNRTRINVTNNLSNDTSIGWRRTTDHLFEVAKYGKTNKGKSFTDDDWYKNRANAHIDHDVLVSWQDTNMSKNMALLMMDLSKRKQTDHYTGMHGIDWAKSTNATNKQRKLTPADMAGMAYRPAKQSQPNAPNVDINGEISAKSGERLILHDAPTINKTRINTTIFEAMGSVNIATVRNKKDDLRDAIKQSSTDEGLYQEENNMKRKAKTTGHDVLWNVQALYKKGISKAVVNYKAAKKSSDQHKLEQINREQMEDDSHDNLGNKSLKTTKIVHNKTRVQTDLEHGPELDKSKQIGGMGTKYMTPYMERDGDMNDINDR